MFLSPHTMLLWTLSHSLPFPLLAPAKVPFPETGLGLQCVAGSNRQHRGCDLGDSGVR